MSKFLQILSKWSIFIYIIIFTVATSETLNRVFLIATCSICATSYLFKGSLTLKKNYFVLGMLAYGAILLLSSTYTVTPPNLVRTILTSYATMLAIVVCVVDNVKKEKDIHMLLNAFIIATVAQFIYMLSVYGTNIFEVIAQSEQGLRVGDETSNSNMVGMSFSYGAVFSLYFLLNKENNLIQKLFYAAIVVIGIIFALFSGSRKALVMMLIGVFMIIYFKSTNKKNVIRIAGGILFGIFAIYLLFNLIKTNEMFEVVNRRFGTLLDGLLGKGELDESSKLRFEMIDTGLRAFRNSPVLGNGIYSSYNYFATYSHNNFVEILMNTGVIGFVVFYSSYAITAKNFFVMNSKNNLYGLMLFLFLWITFGGYGMITYYAKYENVILAIISSWFYMNKISSKVKRRIR